MALPEAAFVTLSKLFTLLQVQPLLSASVCSMTSVNKVQSDPDPFSAPAPEPAIPADVAADLGLDVEKSAETRHPLVILKDAYNMQQANAVHVLSGHGGDWLADAADAIFDYSPYDRSTSSKSLRTELLALYGESWFREEPKVCMPPWTWLDGWTLLKKHATDGEAIRCTATRAVLNKDLKFFMAMDPYCMDPGFLRVAHTVLSSLSVARRFAAFVALVRLYGDGCDENSTIHQENTHAWMRNHSLGGRTKSTQSRQSSEAFMDGIARLHQASLDSSGLDSNRNHTAATKASANLVRGKVRNIDRGQSSSSGYQTFIKEAAASADAVAVGDGAPDHGYWGDNRDNIIKLARRWAGLTDAEKDDYNMKASYGGLLAELEVDTAARARKEFDATTPWKAGNAELPLRPALVADHIVHHGRTKSITDFKDRRKNALSNEECNDNVDLQQVVVYSNGLEVCFQVIYLAISTVAHMRV